MGADQVIVGIGYNGFPRGCKDCSLPWAKKSRSGDALETKYPYVCHAEMNAIMNSTARGQKIYVTLFPCNECAKLIIQSGIREVVFYEDKNVRKVQESSPTKGGLRPDPAYEASRKLLDLAGVTLRQHRPQKVISVSFGGVDEDR